MALSPLTLVIEDGTGKENSNSYTTVEEADEYHFQHLYPETWQNTTKETREAALVWATRLLDENVNWIGRAANIDQALAWPRIWIRRRGHDDFHDYDEIPTFLKYATAELARHLIIEDRTSEEDTKGFSKIKVGDIELDIDKGDRKGILPRSVLSLITGYGTVPGSGFVTLSRR